MGLTSLITAILLTIVLCQYCFNNTPDLILLTYDLSPISKVTIQEAVVIK